MDSLRPAGEEELCALVADAVRDQRRMLLRGGGSKAEVGAPSPDATIVDMRAFAGISAYDPAELVMTVGAGTSLADVQAAAADKGQALAFDPFDHGPTFGRPAGDATIGGVIAAGVAGSRRVSAGGARDHLLGFRAVSGRGEAFVAGGKVVKNVTGYDLPKLACGSWGRLFALTELTLKLLPAAQQSRTRTWHVASPAEAVALMAAAMRSQAGPAAVAYLPHDGTSGAGGVAVRIEGFGPSVQARCAILDELFDEGADTGSDPWDAIRTLAPLGHDGSLWRVSIPPGACAAFVTAMGAAGAHWIVDWAGALIWLRFEGLAATIRDAAAHAGGHAMRLQGPDDGVPAFHPLQAGLAALEARVRRAFDPAGIFETGRF